MRSPFLALGRAVKAWGLEGEIKVEPYADFTSIAAGLGAIHIGQPGGNPARYAVEQVRRAGSAWLLRLHGVETPEQAGRLVGCEVLIPRSAAPALPKGTYYHGDLVGLRVVSEEGRELGRLVDILETGANDVYVVDGQLGELLLPATREVVRCVDLVREIMLVRPLEGMIEAEAI